MDLNTHQALTNDEIEHVKHITNSGNLYYDYDPLIEKARNYAFYVCRQYNQSFINDGKGDLTLLRSLFGKIGQNVQIDNGFITEFGFNTYIENNVVIGQDLKMIDCNTIKIGENVTIGNQVGIYTSNHAMDPEKRATHWCSEQAITLNNNVFIEDGVTILPGITIGENTIIKAASVVTKNIPVNVVAAGIPCKVIKHF